MSSSSDDPSPSDHLLRTLAAVPVSSSVLDLGCGRGRHTEPLLRLGFPVHACDPRPAAVEATRACIEDLVGEETAQTCVQVSSFDELDYPDDTFDWVVADRAEIYASTLEDFTAFLREGHRMLRPGGWLYVTVPTGPNGEEEGAPDPDQFQMSEEDMDACRNEVGLAVASELTRINEAGAPRLRALYRRVTPGTPE